MTIYLDLKEVLEYRHRSRSSHFRDIENGLCTTPIKIGPRSVAWLRPELEALRVAVIAGQSQAEIRQLVSELHLKRRASSVNQAGETK